MPLVLSNNVHSTTPQPNASVSLVIIISEVRKLRAAAVGNASLNISFASCLKTSERPRIVV